MSDTLNVVLIQADLFWEDPTQNRKFFADKINSITSPLDLIVLPEMFTTGFTMNAQPLAETMDGETIKWMKNLAQKSGAAIIGSIIVTENEKFYNRLLFVTPQEEIFHYDKKHLFTFANEQDNYSPGSKKLIVDYRGWKICPLICYDLRFPVWSRNVENYDVLIYVANWPEIRTKAWDVLLQARAIENMAYCIGVNRVGVDGKGFNYVGHSAIYDCLGNNILKNTIEIENTFVTTLDKTHLVKNRNKLNFLNDKDGFMML